MQEPLEKLSENARTVHGVLATDPNATYKFETIAEQTGLSAGDVAIALGELDGASRAAESFRGWSVLT